MKRAIFVLVILVGLGFFAALSVGESRVYYPHSQINNPMLVMQLHQQMDFLRNKFGQLEDDYSQDVIDYARVAEAVKQMDATRMTIRKIVPDKEWTDPLLGLSRGLRSIQKAAEEEDSKILRGALDNLYNSCFRCHSANAPTSKP